MWRKIWCFYLLLGLFSWFGVSPLWAEWKELPPPHKPLKVGVLTIKPFDFFKDGEYFGLSFDIWQWISLQNNFKNNYINLGEDIDAAVDKIASGELDVVIGPIGISSNRLKKVYYTLPFYRSEYVVLAKRIKTSFWSRLNGFFKGYGVFSIGVFVLFYVAYLNLFWSLEYKKNPELKDLSYVQGISKLFWRSFLSKIDRPPFFPESVSACVISGLWLFICAAYFLFVLAGMSASLFAGLNSKGGETLLKLSDLNGKVVGVFGGRSAVNSAQNVGISTLTEKLYNIPEGIALLDEKKIEGIVMYRPFANYFLKTSSRQDLYISPIKLPTVSLGFIFNERMQRYLRQVDYTILGMTEIGKKKLICEKYKQFIRVADCL